MSGWKMEVVDTRAGAVGMEGYRVCKSLHGMDMGLREKKTPRRYPGIPVSQLANLGSDPTFSELGDGNAGWCARAKVGRERRRASGHTISGWQGTEGTPITVTREHGECTHDDAGGRTSGAEGCEAARRWGGKATTTSRSEGEGDPVREGNNAEGQAKAVSSSLGRDLGRKPLTSVSQS